jgi:lambda family phage portal protein
VTKPVFRVQAGDPTGATRRPSALVGAGGRAAHAAADLHSQAMAGWYPPLLSADAAWLPERNISIARIRDMVRSEGWAQSVVDRFVDLSVGATFRLSSKPDARLLGISPEEARELGRQIETRWFTFAEDPTFRCDAQRRLKFVGHMGLSARHLIRDGEAVTLLRWKPRGGWPYATAFQCIDPDRLSTPDGMIDGERIRGGVELDADGAPVAYHFRRRHPHDVGLSLDGFAWDRVPRWDVVQGWERPKVLHLYEMLSADQTRGVSKLVAGLVKSRLLSRYSEAEVKAAAINGSIVGAFYTELGSEFTNEVLGGGGRSSLNWDDWANSRAKYYEDRRTLADARFVTLFPTDKLEMNVNPRNVVGYPAFQAAFLQNFAASLGISYEQLSMDWSKTNYSSARAALNEVWRTITRFRALLADGIAQPIFTAWLEDAIDIGDIDLPRGAPDFYEAPFAYTRAEWIGPPRGYVDPVKEAQAAMLRIQARISTLEREIAEQGGDMTLNLEQLAREDQELIRLGLAPAALPVIAEDDEDPDARDRREREEAGAA